MLPYNEILTVFRSKIWLDILNKHPNYLLIANFSKISEDVLELRVSEIQAHALTKIQAMTSSLGNNSDVTNFLLPLCRKHQASYLCKVS